MSKIVIEHLQDRLLNTEQELKKVREELSKLKEQENKPKGIAKPSVFHTGHVVDPLTINIRDGLNLSHEAWTRKIDNFFAPVVELFRKD